MALALLGVAAVDAAVLLGASYVPQRYTFDMSGGLELGYISGFYAVERNDQFTYRWTSSRSVITIPNVPSQELLATLKFAGPGTDVAPEREATLVVGKSFAARFVVRPGLQEVSLPIPAHSVEDGELKLGLEIQPFSTTTDPRRLGLALVRVELVPVGPVSQPPWSYVGLVVAAVTLTTLATMLSGVGVIPSIGLATVLIVGTGLLQAFDRPALGLFGWSGVLVTIAALVLAVLGRLVTGRFLPLKRTVPPSEASWMLALSLWVFLAIMLGVSYPQFATSDLMMHVHNLEGVFRGDLFFTELLPGGKLAPYPPIYYILLILMTFIYGDLPNLFLVAAAVITASSVPILWMASRAAFESGWPGVVGGWLYALCPTGLLLISAGNHTNIFGQWISLMLFVALLAVQPRGLIRRPGALFVLWILALVVFLSHLGVAEGVMGCLALYVAALVAFPGQWRRADALAMAGTVAGAALAAMVAYYGRFLGLLTSLGVDLASGEGTSAVPVAKREVLWRLLLSLWNSLGSVPLLNGSWGILGAAAVGIGNHRVLLMLAWILGGLIYGVGNILTRTQGRNALFVLAPMALAAGWVVFQWVRRGRLGTVFSVASVGVVTWFGFYDWVLKVLYAYH